MNNNYNYADFVGMSLVSDDDYEPYGYQQELQMESIHSQESTMETRIEHILLNHNKYHIYCE